MGAAALSTEPRGPSWLEATIRDLGALLVASGALTVLWEILGRRALTNEVLAAANLSSDVSGAGLKRVATRYLQDAEWNALLSGPREVDLFFAYAQTWRRLNATALRALVESSGIGVRVVLPDPDDERLMATLSAKFGYTADKLREHILDAKADFENYKRQAHESSSVEVRFTRQFPVFTYYRFDDQCVVVLYSQVVGRADVPMFQAEKGGTLYKHFSGQFDALWEQSDSVRE